MKKTLLSAIIFSTSGFLMAQMPTMDFESWSTMNNGTLAVPEEPTGWITGNQLVSLISPGNSTSVFKVTGAEAHGGSYAMKIVTTDVVNDPSGGKFPDPIGAAFAGKVQLSPLKLKNGFPYTARSSTCNFWYRYTPQTGDSASCGIMLTKWNGTSTDTIAVGGVSILSAAAAYTQGSVTLVYDPSFSTVFPDTMTLAFSATCASAMTCGKVGSTMWLDDITFTGNNGIYEQPTSEGVILYPNPATDQVNISVSVSEAISAIVYDATGRVVATSLFERQNVSSKKSTIVNTTNLSSGLYSYSIVDKSGVALRAGKFSVVR